ncbi:hypothetical protein COO60DRAFT_1516154 [Scenedesmus sp. NREL 46B-D3]|nr:hypothetical protein COO60DRAFT_1516154 [Scenedesmus sp. NREL 46B-D3]
MLQMQHSRTRAGTEGATHAQLQRCSVQSLAVLPCCAPVWALHHIVWLLSLARVACDLSSPQLQAECTCLLIVEPRIAVHRLLCLQCMASAVVLNAGLRQGKVSGHLAAVLSPHVASCALVVALAVRLSCAAGQRCCGCSRAQGERPGAAQAADAGSAEQGSAKGLAGQCAEEDTGLCCW